MALHPLSPRLGVSARGRCHTVADLAGFVDEAGDRDRSPCPPGVTRRRRQGDVLRAEDTGPSKGHITVR